MGDLWLQVVPHSAADLTALGADFGRKTLDQDLAAYTTVLQRDRLNPLRHDAVGMLYLRGGRLDAAASQFRESLRLNPGSAPTHYNLGLVLAARRHYQEATEQFLRTVEIDPNHGDAHNNLGAMPIEGRHRQAAEEFTKALALGPDNPPFLFGLAWVLATSPDKTVLDPAEAIRLGTRAAELGGRRDPAALDALGAAHAAAGDFSRAIATAEEALRVADASGMQALWVEIRERLRLYQRGVRYVLK